MNHTIVIDGSLRDMWTVNEYVPMLKKQYPHCRFALLGVFPESEESLKKNVEHRNEHNKRQTKIFDSVSSYHDSLKVMNKMKDAMDISIFVKNPGRAFPDQEIDIYTKWNDKWIKRNMSQIQIKQHKEIRWESLLNNKETHTRPSNRVPIKDVDLSNAQRSNFARFHDGISDNDEGVTSNDGAMLYLYFTGVILTSTFIISSCIRGKNLSSLFFHLRNIEFIFRLRIFALISAFIFIFQIHV